MIAYLVSKAVGGKQVKLLYTREEDMITASVRMDLYAVEKAQHTGKLWRFGIFVKREYS